MCSFVWPCPTKRLCVAVQAVLGAGSQEMAVEFSAFAENHQLHPPIAQIFEFEEADKALETLRTLGGVGKIVIRV